MKKRKIKNYLKIVILLFSVLLISRACSTEEYLTENSNIKYQTVSSNEAINFISSSKSKSVFNKTENSLNLNVDIKSLKLKKIKNSNLLMPIFQATTKNLNIKSEVFLIKINDTIHEFLLNRIPKKGSNTAKFSGVISITNLNGYFINGYRIENGVFVSQFVRNRSLNSKLLQKTQTDPEIGCDESLDPYSEFCNQSLGEVVITSSSSQTNDTSSLNIISDISWDYSTITDTSSGGGETSSSDTVEVFPCDDPLHGCRDIEPDVTFTETLSQEEVETDEYNPLFFVNCTSFEYYNPPGSLLTAAAVDNMAETFYAMDLTGNIIETDVYYNRVYFTMPSWIRNGQAANLTAEAVTFANNATQVWYTLNPSASKETVSIIWRNNMNSAMTLKGGQFSTVAPFPMRNAGDYQTSLLSSGNCD